MPQITQQVLKIQFKPRSFRFPLYFSPMTCYLSSSRKSQNVKCRRSFDASLRNLLLSGKQGRNLKQKFHPFSATSLYLALFLCVCFKVFKPLWVPGSFLILLLLCLFATHSSNLSCNIISFVNSSLTMKSSVSYCILFFISIKHICGMNELMNKWSTWVQSWILKHGSTRKYLKSRETKKIVFIKTERFDCRSRRGNWKKRIKKKDVKRESIQRF